MIMAISWQFHHGSFMAASWQHHGSIMAINAMILHTSGF
jgi:hypothetical protein